MKELGKDFEVNYKSYVISSNTQIRESQFGAIYFENIGDVPAMINNCIAIAPGLSRTFIEKPNVIIKSDFNITFGEGGRTDEKKLLIVESIYKKI